jgi:hypothetical protein
LQIRSTLDLAVECRTGALVVDRLLLCWSGL